MNLFLILYNRSQPFSGTPPELLSLSGRPEPYTPILYTHT